MHKYYQYSFEDVYGKLWETHPTPFRKEQGNGQMSLEDYYDRDVFGEETREEFIERKLRAMGRCRIMVNRIVSGDFVEINLYPVWENRKDTPRSGERNESRKAQKNLNEKNSRKHLTRLIHANFHKGDLILTPTYAEGCLPDLEQARRDMRNYISRLKRHRKKKGLPPLKYIYVIEYAEEGSKKVRIHHHMIINSMDRDEAESLWKMGRVESKYAQPDDFGLEGFAAYISKLSGRKGCHKYAASKNLDKPKEYKSVTKLSRRKFAEIIKSGDEKAGLLEAVYKGQLKYLDSETYINEMHGGFYLYSRLRRKVSVWKDVENVADKENTLSGGDLRCRAFLEYDWKGKLNNGEAVGSILLEAMYHGIPVTRQYFLKITGTTKNRAELILAGEALRHLKPCAVEFHCRGRLLHTGIALNRFERQRREGYKNIKNADLIEEFLKAAEGFRLSAVSENKNEYSEAMEIQRKKQDISVMEDKRNA